MSSDPDAALPPWYIPDPEGHDLRPDPARIVTAADLAAAMRSYRLWAGNPSCKTLAARCGRRVSASTFANALKGDWLPKLAVVHEFVAACGATAEYREQFELAWRRVAMGAEDRCARLDSDRRPVPAVPVSSRRR